METSLHQNTKIDHEILIHCNWIVLGTIGLGFILEGSVRSNYFIGLLGGIIIIAGFVGHLILNHIFKRNFTTGEIALGLGLFTIGALIFIWFSLNDGLSESGFFIWLTLFALLTLGSLVYLLTRYGVGGAFKKFDVVPQQDRGNKNDD